MRVDTHDTARRVLERKEMFIKDPTHRLHDAAKRLDIQLSGFCDIFAADVYYHQSCYIRFVIKKVLNTASKTDSINTDVLQLFEYKIRTKIVRDKEAYLLHELLTDVSEWSNEHGLDRPVIEHTVELKREILKKFENEIAFFPCVRHLLVHPIDVNPCTYSIATRKGCGLRDRDIASAFGRMIKR